MKKMLAMLLAVLTLCFGAAAMAESVPEVDDAAEQAALTDLTANGQLIEGDGFQFYYSRRLGGCRTDRRRDRGGLRLCRGVCRRGESADHHLSGA